MYKRRVVFGEIRASAKKKTSVARVRLSVANKDALIMVNSQPMLEYFYTELQRLIVLSAFSPIRHSGFKVAVVVRGGGLSSQAWATRLAIMKCMLSLGHYIQYIYNHNSKLTTDSRVVERKKYGHAKARRSFQFSKR